MGRFILFGLRILAWFYALSPSFLRKLYGRGLGWILRTLKLRSRVVKENLEIAFPKDLAQQNRLFGEAYDHLGHLSWEILLLLGPMKRFVRKNSELRGLHHWKQAVQKGKGAIFLASHVGNWEIMAATGARDGIDLMIVTKHLKPEWLHEAIEGGRRECAVGATYEPKTLRDVLGHLKKGGTAGFVLDQYAGPPVGVRVPFFGVPVGTNSVIAMLARRTGAKVLPVVNYRLPNGQYVVDIRPSLDWQTDEHSQRELAINTARYAALLENDVREFPGQWLWTHRRFKGDLSPLRDQEWEEGRSRGE